MRSQILPRYLKAGYGFADLGINVFVIVKQLLLLDFLVNVLGVNAGLAGLITSSVLIFDLFTDPLMGWISDRMPNPIWRRRIWFPIGAAVLVLAVYLTFSPPLGWGREAQALWVWAFFALGSVGFTMVVIPYGALVAELTQDPIQRSQMLAWRMASAALGILLTGAVWPMIAGGDGSQSSLAALVFAPLMILPILTAFFVTRGYESRGDVKAVSFSQQVRFALSSRSFVWLTLLYGLQTLGTAVLAAGIPFAARQLFTVDDAGLTAPLVGALGIQAVIFAFFILGAMLSQPIWASLSKRLSKQRVYVLGSVLYLVGLVLLALVLRGSSLDLLCLLVFFLGVANGAYQQVPWSLIADVIATVAKGRSATVEGGLSGFWLLGQKAANAVGPLLFGLAIGFAGYDAELAQAGGTQSHAVKDAMRWSMSLLPALFFLLSLWPVHHLRKLMDAEGVPHFAEQEARTAT